MAKDTDIELLLIPSGPTEWDEAGRLQGRNDLPLSASAQASLGDVVERIYEELHEAHAPRLVLTGPDEASRSLGKTIAARCGAKTKRLDKLAGLQCGLWEGRLESDLAERSPKAYRKWRQDPTTASPPEGEEAFEAQQRVLAALARALDKAASGPVAIVARPAPVALARLALEGRPLSELWPAVKSAPRVWRHTASRAALKGLPRELGAGA